MIYLASPYSHPNPAARAIRARLASNFQVRALQAGVHLYSPIAAHHGQSEQLPHADAFWRPLNEDMILRSDAVWVLCIHGMPQSVGCQREVRFALRHVIPVRFVNYFHDFCVEKTQIVLLGDFSARGRT